MSILAQFEGMLLDICREASTRILEVYHRPEGFQAREKSDHSPVTEADEAADRYISETLLRDTPYPVVSEERLNSHTERLTFNEYWLVDPLDGTRDFLARDDEFTINIALIRGDESILGMVYLPAKTFGYIAAKGEGAYRLDDKGRTRIHCRPPSGSLRAAVSRFHDSAENEQFCAKHGIVEKIPLGSSLKFGKLAEGEVDVYPRFSGCKEWDVAAGQIIVEEAGGKLIDLVTQKPMRYSKPVLDSNFFVASERSIQFS